MHISTAKILEMETLHYCRRITSHVWAFNWHQHMTLTYCKGQSQGPVHFRLSIMETMIDMVTITTVIKPQVIKSCMAYSWRTSQFANVHKNAGFTGELNEETIFISSHVKACIFLHIGKLRLSPRVRDHLQHSSTYKYCLLRMRSPSGAALWRAAFEYLQVTPVGEKIKAPFYWRVFKLFC